MTTIAFDATAAFLNRADSLAKAGNWKEIATECEAFRAQNGSLPEAAFLSSLAAFHRDDIVAAVREAEEAFDGNPEVSEFAGWLAALYVMVGNLAKSSYYGKLTGALPSSPRVLAWMPSSLPTFADTFVEIEEMPLLRRALSAAAAGRWAEAESWCRQHIVFEANHLDGHLSLAHCLFVQGRFQSAAQGLRAALHNLPRNPQLASLLGQALTEIGRFAESHAMHDWAMSLDPENPTIAAAALNGLFADPSVDAAEAAAATRAWTARFSMAPGALGPVPVVRRKSRLTVGWLLGSIGRSSAGGALAVLQARHNSQRFRFVGFGHGLLTDPHNLVFQKAMDTWHDVKGTDTYTLGAMLAAEDVDILVDLTGLNNPEVLIGLGARMAPVQLSWGGVPVGAGGGAFDGLVSDSVLDPEGEPAPYSERPFLLRLGSVLAELPGDELPLAGGAADPSLTFVADVTLGELSPDTVAAWARILHAVPYSMLLLADRDFRDAANTERLIELFGMFGLAHRVDVGTFDTAADLFAQGDIALLPPGSTRPELALAALWAGLPVVALAGQGRHRRKVDSLLHGLGLGGETLAKDAQGLCDLAVRWAGDAEGRRAFRDGIRARLKSSPAFDAQARAADLEAVLEAAWEEACRKAGA